MTKTGQVPFEKVYSAGVGPLQPWFFSNIVWGTALCNVVLLVLIISSVPVSFVYYTSQTTLCISFLISLMFLADKPLITPIQAVVFLFFFWFGFGPNSIILFQTIISKDLNAAVHFSKLGEDSLWIVSLGLPLYSISARVATSFFSKNGLKANFLTPKGFYYKTQTLVLFFALGLLGPLTTILFSFLGFEAVSYTSYLGGTKTNYSFIGVLNSFNRLIPFGLSALALSFLHKDASKKRKTLTIVVIAIYLSYAIFSGWKSAFIMPFAYIIVGYISNKQKMPILYVVLFISLFLFFVEPFVSSMRILSETQRLENPADRFAFFKDTIGHGAINFSETGFEQVVWGAFFRGIYPLAGNISNHSSWFKGEWGGETIKTGVLATIPRSFHPSKPDMNIGNFFYKTIYSRTYNINVTSDIMNVAISAPFEFVGNFGFLAGIFSFCLIGFLWASMCCFILTPERLWNHPLTPYFVFYSMVFEKPFGHILAQFRTLAIMLIILWLVNRPFFKMRMIQ